MHLIALALSGASLAMLYEIYIGKVKIQMWQKVYQVCNNIDDLNVVKNKKSKFSDGEILAKIKNGKYINMSNYDNQFTEIPYSYRKNKSTLELSGADKASDCIGVEVEWGGKLSFSFAESFGSNGNCIRSRRHFVEYHSKRKYWHYYMKSSFSESSKSS